MRSVKKVGSEGAFSPTSPSVGRTGEMHRPDRRKSQYEVGGRPKVKGVRAAIRRPFSTAQPCRNRPPAARRQPASIYLLTLWIKKARLRRRTGGFPVCRVFGVGSWEGLK